MMAELSLPDDLKDRMETFPEVNWSSVAREAIEDKLEKLQFLKEFSSGSEMTEEDALALGKKLNERLARRYE